MPSIWEKCNRTELYQICRRVGLSVHPADTKERLIAVLDEVEPDAIYHPVDAWRHGIAAFVDEFWAKIQAQLTCPAVARTPTCCFGCSDMRVLACVTTNSANPVIDKLIRIRRK